MLRDARGSQVVFQESLIGQAIESCSGLRTNSVRYEYTQAQNLALSPSRHQSERGSSDRKPMPYLAHNLIHSKKNSRRTLYAHSERVSEVRRAIAQPPQLFRRILEPLFTRLSHEYLPLLVYPPVRQRRDGRKDQANAYE